MHVPWQHTQPESMQSSPDNLIGKTSTANNTYGILRTGGKQDQVSPQRFTHQKSPTRLPRSLATQKSCSDALLAT
jgi:hypothetical protein